jgi:hypothetical protein
MLAYSGVKRLILLECGKAIGKVDLSKNGGGLKRGLKFRDQ